MLQITFVVGCHNNNITTTRTGGVMKETNGRLRIGKFWYPLDYDFIRTTSGRGNPLGIGLLKLLRL